jgi:endonuclease/exonuclease/phosphatase family metal-dependent hydrolase
MLPICVRPEGIWPKLSSIQVIRGNLVYIISLILGGDFNTEPDVEKGSPYQLIQEHSMKNCMQEIYKNFGDKIFATYGNAKNTFTGGKEKPVIYDYIFHQANKNNIISWTKWFEILFLQTTVKVANSEISISDHQGIEAAIKFWN